jgi:hypothetical protein
MLGNGNECREKNYGNKNLKATNPITNYDASETTVECGIFKLFG